MNNIRLGDVLIDFGYITRDQLQAALAYQKEHKNLRVGQALQELGYVNEHQVLEALAQRLHLRVIDFAQINADISAVEKVPRELAQKYDMLPIAINGRSLVIAANDPLNYYAIEDIRQLTSMEPEIVLAELEPLRRSIQYYYAEVRARLETGPDVNVRVSILPTVFGEKAVLRLLATNTHIEHADHFGMDDETYKRFRPLLDRPNGIVYLTGPTGSGKTTTLYMVLQEVAQRQVNVSTIEDPVERNLDRINQTQVNNVAGLTFESGLRALLRQDPDVIMVGETRDAETASISVRAAITGHMVFSTLHTNDALSSIVRLEDMGVERYMIANSLAGVVAQRLMRRVCPACARKVPVTEAEAELLGPGIPFVARGTGCPQCNGTGYKGRVAIHEMVVINKALRRMIAEGASIEEMTDAARKTQGMRSLRESAVQLVRDGVTTPEELLKITYFEE